MADRGPVRSYRKDRERKRSTDKKMKDIKPKDTDSTDKRQEESSPSEVQKVEEMNKEIEKKSEEKEEIPVLVIDESIQEKATLDEYIRDIGGRIQWKINLRKINNEASNNRPDDDKHLYKLDSSLKKNTAFIRKCKTFSDGQKDQLVREMKGLNLTKYMGELAQGLMECKLKMSDVHAMVEFCSAVHQMYADFGICLLENWARVLAMKKEDKIANPSKLRVDLRLFSELISTGIFKLKESLSVLGNVLTTLVAQDKESLSNISIIISFCKHCGDDYAGLVPYSITKLAEKHRYTLPRANLLPPEKQKPLRNILKDYYACLSAALVELHKELAVTERGNRRQLLTRGEISNERKEKAERLAQEKEKLIINTQQMAEAVGEAMVELPVMQSEKDEEEEAELAAEVTEDNLGSLWDDDDTKAFYECLPDLVAIIPSILYKDSKEEAEAETKEEKKTAIVLNEDDDDIQPDEEEVEEVNLEEEEEVNEAINLSNKMVFDAFLSQLPSCVNREMIDSAAAEFCMNHNTKINRKRLVKSLFTVHRTRTDLLPFYSRLVAALGPCMPDVPVQLCAMLKQDFRWQVRKKDPVNIESKLKVCRFIGELVKFGLFAKADALFCLKQLLFDFTHHHIEMACTLVESCGIYLYRSADSHRRIKIYLEQMQRKKAALSMDSRSVTMIENAYYTVSPPDTPLEQRKERPPAHQFIRKLLYTDLNKSNCEKILKQVRKFNWEDPEVAAYIIKCIKNVWNIKYFNIRYLASLLSGLILFHDWIATAVTDDILEDIRMGMEVNNPKFYQRRTSVIKFLGELYNYRIVDSSLIFKVLYSLITFGIVLDHGESENSLDPPQDMVRLRLVCVLLDTCGQYFSTGSSKKKLDYFLLYFQRYFWFKRSHPMYTDERKFPLGVNNLFLETITTLRPKLKLFSDFEESCVAVQKAENEFLSVLKKKGLLADVTVQPSSRDSDALNTISEENEEENSHSQHSADISHSQHSNNRSRSASQAAPMDDEMQDWEDNREEVDQGSQDSQVGMEQGEEELLLPSAPVKVHCEEDDEFLAALDKMVNENITESKSIVRDRNNIVNLTAPISTAKAKKTWEQLQEEEGKEEEGGRVQVMIMLRKGTGGGGGGGGAKFSKGITVSADSQLGEQFIAREEKEAREKARLKKLTLEISERQEEEELNEAVSHLQRVTLGPSRRGFKPQKGAPDADAIFGKKSAKF